MLVTVVDRSDFVKYASISDMGIKRETNEDYYKIIDLGYPEKPIFFMLADGMGGHKAGEVASKTAVEFVADYIRTIAEELFSVDSNKIIYSMEEMLKKSNEKLRDIASSNIDCEGMGTTFIFVCIHNNNMYICHIGDSRTYLIREDSISCITKDHSYIEELVELGEITREEAENHPRKNVITRALGVDEIVEIDKYTQELAAGDIILLCSDGLSNELSDTEIFEILKDNESPQKACQIMVDCANRHGGEDNITVIVIKP